MAEGKARPRAKRPWEWRNLWRKGWVEKRKVEMRSEVVKEEVSREERGGEVTERPVRA